MFSAANAFRKRNKKRRRRRRRRQRRRSERVSTRITVSPRGCKFPLASRALIASQLEALAFTTFFKEKGERKRKWGKMASLASFDHSLTAFALLKISPTSVEYGGIRRFKRTKTWPIHSIEVKCTKWNSIEIVLNVYQCLILSCNLPNTARLSRILSVTKSIALRDYWSSEIGAGRQLKTFKFDWYLDLDKVLQLWWRIFLPSREKFTEQEVFGGGGGGGGGAGGGRFIWYVRIRLASRAHCWKCRNWLCRKFRHNIFTSDISAFLVLIFQGLKILVQVSHFWR